MYLAYLVNLSTITSIALYATLVAGSLKTSRPVIKSIEMSTYSSYSSSQACISP